MSHIVIIHTGLKGISNIVKSLSDLLIAEDYKITITTPSAHYNLNHEATYKRMPGVSFNANTPLFDFILLAPNKKLMLAKEKLNYNAQKSHIIELKPDLLLIDIEIHEAIIAAEESEVPYMIISQWCYNRPFSDVPSLNSGIIPGLGIKGSTLMIKLNWVLEKLRLSKRIAKTLMRGKLDRRFLLSTIMKAETKMLKPIINEFPPNFIYENRPIWSFTMEEFDFAHSQDVNFRYAGPFFRESQEIEADQPPLIRDILLKKKQENKKLIYMSLSSFHSNDPSVVEKCIQAVVGEKNWILLISRSGQPLVVDEPSISQNVYVVDWVNQFELLRHVDCSINHGGINTINECINNQVPMLVFSGGKFDQNGCAARVHYHRIGIAADFPKVTSERIHEYLILLCSQSEYFLNIKEFQKTYLSRYKKADSAFMKAIQKELKGRD